MHLERMSLPRLKRVGQAIVRTLADSHRTDEIIVAEEITAQAQLSYLLRSGTFDGPEGRDLLRDRPQFLDLDLDELRAMPPGSLGREYVGFLDREGLTLEVMRVPTPYTDDPDCAYVMQRLRQSHDLWHTLLGLGTQGHEEVLVHAFSIAQTGLPSSVVIISLGAIKHMVLERRWKTLRHGVRAAFDRGVRAKPLLAAYWERYWERPLDEVRAHFGIEPMPAELH